MCASVRACGRMVRAMDFWFVSSWRDDDDAESPMRYFRE